MLLEFVFVFSVVFGWFGELCFEEVGGGLGGGLLILWGNWWVICEDTFVALFTVVFWRFSRVLDGFGAIC